MRTRAAKPDERIFTFKIIQSNEYGRVRDFPYRVLAIPDEFTLYQFAEAINDCFDFAFDHPFGFYSNLKQYYDSDEGYELFADIPETRGMDDDCQFDGVKKTRVNRVFTQPKKKMLFLFDYGDEWHFRVELKEISDPEPGQKYPRLIRSGGQARPQYEEPDLADEKCSILSVDKSDELWHLDDVLDLIERIELVTENISFKEFSQDTRRVAFIRKSIHKIGSAIRKFPSGLKERYPLAGWDIFDDLRWIATHNPPDINPMILWDCCTVKLPGLKKHVTLMITREIDRRV